MRAFRGSVAVVCGLLACLSVPTIWANTAVPPESVQRVAGETSKKMLSVGDGRPAEAAEIAQMQVLGADGEPLDIAGAWVAERKLAVIDPGLTVSCVVEASEGVSDVEVGLRINDVEVDPLEDGEIPEGTFVFPLDSETCKATELELAKVKIVATYRDETGAEQSIESSQLSELAVFKDADVERLLFVDPEDEKTVPQTYVLFDGVRAQSDGIQYTKADEVLVKLGLVDPLFDQLNNSRWFDSRKPEYTIGEAKAELPADSFTSKGDGAYETDELAKLTEEGRHEVDFTYTGALLASESGKPAALVSTANGVVVIDRTAPKLAGASIKGGYEPDGEVAQMPGQDGQSGFGVLFGGERTLSLRLVDMSGKEGVETSGVGTYEITVVCHDDLDASDKGKTKTYTQEQLKMNDDGIVELPLENEGTYLLSEIRVTVEDRAGNKSGPVSIDAFFGTSGFDRVSVDDPHAAAKDTFDIEVDSDGLSGADRYYHNDTVSVTLWGKGWRFELFRHTLAFRSAVSASCESWKGEQELAGFNNQPDFTFNKNKDRWEAELDLPADPDGGVSDGVYRIKFRGAYMSPSKARDFMVDTTSPVITDTYLSPAPDAQDDISDIDGVGRLVLGGTRELHVRVQDLQPRFEGDGDPQVDEMNEAGTAGVDEASLTVLLKRLTDLNGWASPTLTVKPEVDEQGWLIVPLNEEGVYRLRDIELTAPDAAGNGRRVALGVDGAKPWGFDGVLVDSDATMPEVRLTVADADGTPLSKDPHYHRGNVKVTAYVEDRWFEARRAVAGDSALTSTISLQKPGEAAPAPLAPITFADFARVPGTHTWVASYELPEVGVAPQAKPQEGEYRMGLAYRTVAGTPCIAEPLEFGVDYTGPSFGKLSLSAEDPFEWGWIFADEPLWVSLDVTDNLSGVDGDTGSLTAVGTADLDLTFTPGATKNLGTLAFALDQDGSRLVFDGTHVGIEDAAGNPADSGTFAGRVGTELPGESLGICVDTESPQVSVTYDNNDVSNGRYYKAPRTATITVVESNFDLIRRHDEHRAIATVERNGHGSSVAASEFDNPSGDGKTWIALVPCESDADWVLSASLADPTGKEGGVERDDFIVDTIAPAVLVQFDNNEVANGMYFKAPRTATVTVMDRNFDPALAQVAPWARDAGNSPAAAPAVAAWQTGDPRAEWVTSVSFTNELHYGMSVAVTDLAGNVAEPYEEPEFVIDLTAPSLSIGGISQHAAYADAVMPTISYSDVNFDPMFATYEITGAARGDVFMPATETENAGGKKVDFADFEHELENDDVYTLTAAVDDLAGNTAEQSVTFSVNRFGSTYYFPNAESDVAGKFLDMARRIEIAEVNVSGLDMTRSHAEIVHDARTQVLRVGEDYEVIPGADGAWSVTTYRFPRELFAEDGYYRILLTSHDLAGNLSQNTMDGKDSNREGTFEVGFAVDGTAPFAALSGVGSHGVYLDPQKHVPVDVHDNIELLEASLSVDGERVQEWKGAGASAQAPEFRMSADGKPHSYELTAIDRAGNKTVARYDDVVVTGDWLTFILNTPRLLFTAVGGGIFTGAVVTAGAWAAWRHVKRTRELRERLNS